MRKTAVKKEDAKGVSYFEGLGWIVPKRSDLMRPYFNKRYGHQHLAGKRSGKSIYLPKSVYNFFIDRLRAQERKLGVDYRFGYEEIAELVSMRRGPRRVK